MIGFETATRMAKDYVSNQGIHLVRLKEARKQGDKWVVTYEDPPLIFPPFAQREKYTVELLQETGEIVAFQREPLKSTT